MDSVHWTPKRANRPTRSTAYTLNVLFPKLEEHWPPFTEQGRCARVCVSTTCNISNNNSSDALENVQCAFCVSIRIHSAVDVNYYKLMHVCRHGKWIRRKIL